MTKIFTRNRLFIFCFISVLFASILVVGVQAASADDEYTRIESKGKVWNAETIDEAENIAGYDIAIPGYIPEDFELGSTFMISELNSKYSHKTVDLVYVYKEDPSYYILLSQSPVYFKIAGAASGKVGEDDMGQILRTESTKEGKPATFILSWHKGDTYYILDSAIIGSVDEGTLRKIAASIQLD